MQNYNAPPPGQGGYGAPPTAKKGISKGCIIAIIVAVVLAVGAVVVVVVAGGLGFYFLNQSPGGGVAGSGTPSRPGGSGGGSSTSTSTSSNDDAEGPQPTAAQSAAVSGGQTARWEQQEMEWTVPQRWTKQTASSTSYTWRSPGSDDAANLIVSISPLPANFPTDIGTTGAYDQAATRKANGEVDEYKYLKLGGVKGVMFREAAPEDEDGHRRLQWIGYRDYKGQKQQVNIMLATYGKYFARHEDAMYGVLYSTKF